jgi:DNA-binding IclR family transcriptional regulator
MGKALLAFTPREVVDEVIAAGLTRHTPHTITEPAVLHRALAKIRRDGYATGNQGHFLGAVSVAAPVLGSDGYAVAAISVVVHSVRANVARLGPAVRTAAQGIARQIGTQPPR